MRQWGIVLLAIWLIIRGLMPLLGITFPASGMILDLLALVSGILLLFEGKGIKLSENLGIVLLGIWLIATGLIPILDIRFPASGTILALLAVAAGILLLLRR